MNKKKLLSKIQKLYNEDNINITSYLKEIEKKEQNDIEDILISYDFQAGSYSKKYKEDPNSKKKHLSKLIDILNSKLQPINSCLEVGVGEATSMIEIIKSLNLNLKKIYGFDISWSRIKYAQKMIEEYGLENTELFTADLFEMPFNDNSIDLVYTIHALEPNGGKEVQAIKELYRVSNKYVVLVEPCYEVANEESKERMDKLGYVKGIREIIQTLGYTIIIDEMLENDINPLNKAKIIVIEKESIQNVNYALSCPLTKTPLVRLEGCYYSSESLLAYPIINGIPCLLSENAIVATKMLESEFC